MKSLCIFCGAHSGTNPIYEEVAMRFAKLLAQHKIELIYGGGKVQGVIPQGLVDQEVAHTGLTKLHVVDTMHKRKELMYDLSAGFVAMPGGFGTLDEFFEILTWSQLGLHKKPIGFLNVNGYFNYLLQYFEFIVEEGFVESALMDRIIVEEDEALLLEQLASKEIQV